MLDLDLEARAASVLADIFESSRVDKQSSEQFV